jgi:hypothetical protein
MFGRELGGPGVTNYRPGESRHTQPSDRRSYGGSRDRGFAAALGSDTKSSPDEVGVTVSMITFSLNVDGSVERADGRMDVEMNGKKAS